MSSLEETPSEPVVLGSLQGCVVSGDDDVAVSIEIACGHIIVHVSYAMLVSLFSTSELYPMSLGFFDWVACKCSLEIGISIEIAPSLFVINSSSEHEVVTLVLYLLA